MAPKPRILVVLTSTSSFNHEGKEKKTGWYLPEFSHPYDVLKDHVDLVIASPNGGAAPIDPSSIEATKEDKISVDFLNNKKDLYEKTEKLEKFVGRTSEFDGIFYVGGLGPMWDLATSATSQKIIVEFHEANKILAAVCHGPVAFSHVKLPDGSYLLDGHKVTGFSNSEEAVMGYTNAVPFSLEDQLNKASGGGYVKAEQDWGEKVITEKGKGGGWLITGQNPASAKGVGEAILAKLQA